MHIKIKIVGNEMQNIVYPVSSVDHARTVLAGYNIEVPYHVLNYFLDKQGSFTVLVDESVFKELEDFYNEVHPKGLVQ